MKKLIIGLIALILLTTSELYSDDDWSQVSPSPKPSARKSQGMAYIDGDQVLLFGGDNGSS